MRRVRQSRSRCPEKLPFRETVTGFKRRRFVPPLVGAVVALHATEPFVDPRPLSYRFLHRLDSVKLWRQ